MKNGMWGPKYATRPATGFRSRARTSENARAVEARSIVSLNTAATLTFGAMPDPPSTGVADAM